MGRRSDPGSAVRAAARASWPIRRYRIGEEPGDDLSASADLSASTTASERLEMMWPLARDAWAFAGRTIPDYSRGQTPVRVVRPTD